MEFEGRGREGEELVIELFAKGDGGGHEKDTEKIGLVRFGKEGGTHTQRRRCRWSACPMMKQSVRLFGHRLRGRGQCQ